MLWVVSCSLAAMMNACFVTMFLKMNARRGLRASTRRRTKDKDRERTTSRVVKCVDLDYKQLCLS